MPEEKDRRTIDSILRDLKAIVENKSQPLRAEHWIDAAFMLNLLLIDAEKIINQSESDVAKIEDAIYEAQEKKNVSAAKLKMKTKNEWVEFKNAESLKRRIEELIRIAKKRSDRSAGV